MNRQDRMQPGGDQQGRDGPRVPPIGAGEAPTPQLNTLQQQMNNLLRRDATTNELYVAESQLTSMLRANLPPALADQCIREMRNRLAKQLRPDPKGAATPVPWQELVKYTAATSKGSTLEGLGLSPKSSMEQVKAVVRKQRPDLPDWMFDETVNAKARSALGKLEIQAQQSAAAPSFSSCFLGLTGWNFLICGLIVLIALFVGVPLLAVIAIAAFAVVEVFGFVFCALQAALG